MPTATGKETAQEKRDRERSEDYAARRNAITPEIRDAAERDAHAVLDGAPIPDYPGGDEYQLIAGARRKLPTDEGRIRALALADALESMGIATNGYTMRFGIGAGPDSIRYSVIPADFAIRQRKS